MARRPRNPLLIFPISREGKSTKTKKIIASLRTRKASRTKCAHGKPTCRLVFPSPAVRAFPPFRLPQSGQRKRKDRPFGRSFPVCKFKLKPGSDTGFQRGISHPAGCDLRPCLKTPQAFRERLARKLQLGVRCLFFLLRDSHFKLRLLHELHKLFTCNRLVVIQILGQRMQLIHVIA